ncbi:MAG: hypothetical protein K0S11_1841 [Gammaproteobacteria bacterium]|jgi:hypothetical protein|nr:hypothetical protein [Gammaproteobacteria bacterium]
MQEFMNATFSSNVPQAIKLVLEAHQTDADDVDAIKNIIKKSASSNLISLITDILDNDSALSSIYR